MDAADARNTLAAAPVNTMLANSTGSSSLPTAGTTTAITTLLQQIRNFIRWLSENKEGLITTGSVSQYYRGDKSWQDFGSAARSVVLTGLSITTNAAIVAADSVISALGKLQAQITDRYTKSEVNSALSTKSDTTHASHHTYGGVDPVNVDTRQITNMSEFGRSLVDDASAADARNTLSAAPANATLSDSAGSSSLPAAGRATAITTLLQEVRNNLKQLGSHDGLVAMESGDAFDYLPNKIITAGALMKMNVGNPGQKYLQLIADSYTKTESDSMSVKRFYRNRNSSIEVSSYLKLCGFLASANQTYDITLLISVNSGYPWQGQVMFFCNISYRDGSSYIRLSHVSGNLTTVGVLPKISGSSIEYWLAMPAVAHTTVIVSVLYDGVNVVNPGEITTTNPGFTGSGVENIPATVVPVRMVTISPGALTPVSGCIYALNTQGGLSITVNGADATVFWVYLSRNGCSTNTVSYVDLLGLSRSINLAVGTLKFTRIGQGWMLEGTA